MTSTAVQQQLAANMDTYWRWEWFKGRDCTVAAVRQGSAALSCEYYRLLMSRFGCRSVLDCSCGPGRKAVLLAEGGMEVCGSDISGVAVERSRDLAREFGVGVQFVRSAWQDLSRNLPRTFDCIVNDAVAWVETRDDLQAATCEFYRMLNPGGILIFQGDDEFSDPRRRAEMVAGMIESSRRARPRVSLDGRFSRGDTQMTQLTIRDYTPDAVVQTFLYLVDEAGTVRLESASLAELCRWSWQDFVQTLGAAGFREVHSHQLTAGGKQRVYNVARK
jgi:SAM-dependent methyltransferase